MVQYPTHMEGAPEIDVLPMISALTFDVENLKQQCGMLFYNYQTLAAQCMQLDQNMSSQYGTLFNMINKGIDYETPVEDYDTGVDELEGNKRPAPEPEMEEEMPRKRRKP